MSWRCCQYDKHSVKVWSLGAALPIRVRRAEHHAKAVDCYGGAMLAMLAAVFGVGTAAAASAASWG